MRFALSVPILLMYTFIKALQILFLKYSYTCDIKISQNEIGFFLMNGHVSLNATNFIIHCKSIIPFSALHFNHVLKKTKVRIMLKIVCQGLVRKFGF